MGEPVPGLYRMRAGVVAEERGLDPADDAAVQELVVHVQQVLVHERIVAAHSAGERHGLVPGGIELRQLWQRCLGCIMRVSREDEHQAVSLADRISADTARRRERPPGAGTVSARCGRSRDRPRRDSSSGARRPPRRPCSAVPGDERTGPPVRRLCRCRRGTTRSAHLRTWRRTSFSSARPSIQRPGTRNSD